MLLKCYLINKLITFNFLSLTVFPSHSLETVKLQLQNTGWIKKELIIQKGKILLKVTQHKFKTISNFYFQLDVTAQPLQLFNAINNNNNNIYLYRYMYVCTSNNKQHVLF